VRAIQIIHSLFIFCVSGGLIYSIANSIQRKFFGSSLGYSVHVIVCLFLVLVALVLLWSHFRCKEKVAMLQIIWWIPQLVVVCYSNLASYPSETYSVYFMPYPFFLPFKFTWMINQNISLAIAINFAPAMFICLNLLLLYYWRTFLNFLEKRRNL